MIYNFIMCAGKQSRFKSNIPKALMKIEGKTILDINIENSINYCDKIIIVSSIENNNYFLSFKNEKVDLISIRSGFGCGDAVYKALSKIKFKKDDICFITWGDSIQNNKEIYIKSLIKYNNNIIVPVVLEDKPYVQIITDKDNIKGALFSKYNENIKKGYHDLSIFLCNCNKIFYCLKKLKNKIFIDGKYNHKHNNEFLFLDIFNEIKGNYKIIEINNYKDLSFNTLEQFEKIKNKI